MVLIGDGFAEGLGDWVVMAGMAGAARHLEREAEADEKVRRYSRITMFVAKRVVLTEASLI